MIAEGQVHGGVAQGIANALFEEIVYDGDGNILTASLADYPAADRRARSRAIEIRHLETDRCDASITGAKGLGEGGAIGAPAAVLNAISDALQPFGVERLRDAGDAAAHPRGDPRRGRPRASGHDHAEGHARPSTASATTVEVEPRRTLADALRDDCGLTGTHLGCEHGVCGACTVLVDGRPGALLPDVRGPGGGREIRTVEGLADGDALHPLQEAFWRAPRAAMRLLHAGLPDARGGVLEREPRDRRRGAARRAVLEPLPLHRLSEHPQGGTRRGGRDAVHGSSAAR